MALDLRQMTRNVARRYGIPEELAIAQIGAESGFNPRAVSPAGAQGIAQFMPGTARAVGLRNPFDPQASLEAYGRHMRTLYKNFGRWDLALAAYNAGGGAVQKHGNRVPPYAETQAYVKKILSLSKVSPTAAAAASAGQDITRAYGGTPQTVATGQPTEVPRLSVPVGLQKEIGRWMQQSESRLASGQAADDSAFEKLVNRIQSLPRGVQVAGQPRPATATGGGGDSGSAPGGSASYGGGGGGRAVNILPGAPAWGSFGYPDPEGQGGKHMAVDWFAKAGTPFVSPVNGRVVRLTPDPSPGKKASGQVFGGTIAIRDDSGRLFVMRHSTPKNFRVGQRVTAGMVLGTVKDWAGSPHIHLEVYRPGSSDREYSARMALNPREVFGR